MYSDVNYILHIKEGEKQMIDIVCNIRDQILGSSPLIHCITNPISINQCANTILSIGAKPVMAEHPKEVSEITSTADALMLNTGNITDVRMKSIMLSAKKGKETGIPILIDVVGIACSQLRRNYVLDLLKCQVPDVIKGNYSEILALHKKQFISSGVDTDTSLDACYITKVACILASEYKTVIMATGETDIITDGKKVFHVKNGTFKLTLVTGTGCMLGSLSATFMTAASPLYACASACLYFGICGELANTDKGSGSFMINLIDKISTLRKEEIIKNFNLEEFDI